MTQINKIYNWLAIAFTHTGWGEVFYFDKKDSEFFSIHFFDYALLNDDLSFNEKIQSSYPPDAARKLASKIQRKEKFDKDIFFIPPLTIEQRKAGLLEFINALNDSEIKEMLIKRVLNPNWAAQFELPLAEPGYDSLKVSWANFRHQYLIKEIESYLNIKEIDLSCTSIFYLGSEDWMLFNVGNNPPSKPD